MSFFFILSVFLAVQYKPFELTANEKEKVDQKILQIDQKINELELVKRGYAAKAIRHEDQAETKQFNQEYNLEARRHYQLAEQNREVVQGIQEEIDLLEEEKQKILSRK